MRAEQLAAPRDLPAENNGFANNMLQAISTRNADEHYSRALLLRSERRISNMLRSALLPERRWLLRQDGLSHLLFMVFDGFAVNYKLNGQSRRAAGIADTLTKLLIGAARVRCLQDDGIGWSWPRTSTARR